MGNILKFEKKPDLIPTLICTACGSTDFSLQRNVIDQETFFVCANKDCKAWFSLNEGLEAIGHEL